MPRGNKYCCDPLAPLLHAAGLWDETIYPNSSPLIHTICPKIPTRLDSDYHILSNLLAPAPATCVAFTASPPSQNRLPDFDLLVQETMFTEPPLLDTVVSKVSAVASTCFGNFISSSLAQSFSSHVFQTANKVLDMASDLIMAPQKAILPTYAKPTIPPYKPFLLEVEAPVAQVGKGSLDLTSCLSFGCDSTSSCSDFAFPDKTQSFVETQVGFEWNEQNCQFAFKDVYDLTETPFCSDDPPLGHYIFGWIPYIAKYVGWLGSLATRCLFSVYMIADMAYELGLVTLAFGICWLSLVV